MGTDVVKSYDALHRELEEARSNLKGLNDNIRRIIGRDPIDSNLRGERKRNFNDSRRDSDRQRNRDREMSPLNAKRRPQETKSVFSRLSGPPMRDEDTKPKIHSRVIRELPTRQEIVAAQGVDEESRARNRRMFGCLLGTLQKFCQEESKLKEREDMKAQMEKKVEEQQIQERKNLKKERQALFSDRKRQQLEIRKLELKMTRLREFEVWEKAKKDLYNFIKTKSKPHIYYRPKLMNEAAEKKLASCRTALEHEIEKRRTEINEEIMAIENRFKVREEQILGKDYRDEPTKHYRRNNGGGGGGGGDDDDDDEDHDSLYDNSDEAAGGNDDTVVVKIKLEDTKENVDKNGELIDEKDTTIATPTTTSTSEEPMMEEKDSK